MPAFFAFCASSFPTSVACSVFGPLKLFARCSQEAAASVRPSVSSTSCASIPRLERKTTRRGRSAVPRTLPRTRRWRRSRASRTLRLGTLAHLPAHVLALVADALALVRLRRAHLPDLRRRLPDELLVDSFDDFLRRD